MILNLILTGVKWLASAAPGLIASRPQDIIFGFIAATLTVFLFTGPSSIFWNFLEIVITILLMYGLWILCNFISDKVECSVFTLPDDAATRKARKEVNDAFLD